MFYVYIMSNKRYTVFYTGLTDNISRRSEEQKLKLVEGFTKKYNCTELIYYEEFEILALAQHREKQLKRYKREWKKNLINELNPSWVDLYHKL